MDVAASFPMPVGGYDSGRVLAAVNGKLSAGGLALSKEDANTLAEKRAEALTEIGRVEFGEPAITFVAEAIATSPFLSQAGLCETLAALQDIFYALRDELPVDVPDMEIAEALRGCLDAWEGDVAELAALPAEEVMAFSTEYTRLVEAEDAGEYRIVDDEGRVYAFDPGAWGYDEQAAGWNGEGWADDWDD